MLNTSTHLPLVQDQGYSVTYSVTSDILLSQHLPCHHGWYLQNNPFLFLLTLVRPFVTAMDQPFLLKICILHCHCDTPDHMVLGSLELIYGMSIEL